jgi:2-dehydropantoate 2-reductase
MRIAIVGAGTLGSILGAHLAHAGHEVVMVARGARARQVAAEGLAVTGLATLRARVAVAEEGRGLVSADLLVLATKTYATGAALAPLARVEVGAAFSMQNGLMKNEQLAGVFGRGQVLGCIANTSGELLAGGTALFTRNEALCIGEPDGAASARVAALAGAIDAAGVRTLAVTDILSLEWSKFAAWAALMILAVGTRQYSWRFLTDPDTALLVARIVREVGQLARACGVELSDGGMMPVATLCAVGEARAVELVRAEGAQMEQRAPRHRMSTLQDLEAGRELEVEETLGYALRRGAELGLDLPLLATGCALARGLNRMRTAPG